MAAVTARNMPPYTDTDTTSSITLTGSKACRVVPLPSWPCSLLPHIHRDPSVLMAAAYLLKLAAPTGLGGLFYQPQSPKPSYYAPSSPLQGCGYFSDWRVFLKQIHQECILLLRPPLTLQSGFFLPFLSEAAL